MKVLVTGKTGQLGRSIKKIVSGELYKDQNTYIFSDRLELDLSDDHSITDYFQNHNFDIVVNCAAYTKVDKAEEEFILADQINHHAVKLLAEICSKRNIMLIHISTDYVYDGESINIYKESDQTNPINIYGKTKLAGELEIEKLMPNNAVIIRTSWLYSEFGGNFVDSIMKKAKMEDQINVINDQYGSPTYALDLANIILLFINNADLEENYKNKTQIYHFSNNGLVSWYDFAVEIVNLAKIDCTVKYINSAHYLSHAKRPRNTSMSKDKIINKFDLNINDWKNSLMHCLSNLDNTNL